VERLPKHSRQLGGGPRRRSYEACLMRKPAWMAFAAPAAALSLAPLLSLPSQRYSFRHVSLLAA
jgi:hypothetical protein